MKQTTKTGSVLVVGGGIAGIQASLDLADSGYKVYLVESGTAIGGRMAQLDKTFPTNDCAMCTISPRLVAAGTHRNIEIITNAELSKLSGQAGNFESTISIKPHFIDLEKCTGCGLCAEHCPVPVKDEYNQLLNDRKAIYKEYPQAVPNKYAMNKEGIAPCYDACPVHGNPSGYVALIAAGKFKEAYESATMTNPFPSICGRICEHPCEQSCNRDNLDSPVSIAYLKRFVADWYAENCQEPTAEEKQAEIENNGKKIAIVGSGPAGLSGALDLRKMGYSVTIFEKHDVIGGMLREVIPEYRLPTDIIERDIQNILDYGIDVKLNTAVKGEKGIEKLLDDGFEAVFLSVGMHKSMNLGLEGEDLENVSVAIDFLRDVRTGEKKSVKENVTVIGGGNVAMDCARTVLRLGAKQVNIVCLEAEDKMPAHQWEIDWAIEEGVTINAAKATKRIIANDGRFAGLELLDVKRMAFVQGRLELETTEGSEQILQSEELIVSIGQKSDFSFMPKDGKIKLNERGRVDSDPDTGQTSWPKVFIGGDMARGPASVVQATADGQRVAQAIDAYIKGEKFVPAVEEGPVVEISTEELIEQDEQIKPRQQMPVIGLDKRKNSFDEVDLGFTEEMAVNEAKRCLYCAICSYCKRCSIVCEADAILYNDVPKERKLDVGAVILATGFDLYDASKKAEYGYRRFPNVISGLDYERILSASGPTQGHIQRISDSVEPKKIAFIQCVGSRDKENDYCSSVCCMYATKQAVITKEHLPDAECKIFVMDIRAFGKGFDEYVERAKTKYGIDFIYTRPSGVRQNFTNQNLSLEFTEDGSNWLDEEFDMVVLSSGLCVSEKTTELGNVCGIDLNKYNFAQSAIFDPTSSSRQGIYLAGAIESPKDIPESVVQASGAAAQAMELLAEVRGTEVEEKIYPPEKDISEQQARVGVFVCNCGSNIGGVIDCAKVADYASGLDNVVYSGDLMYTCSPDGLLNIKEKIEEHDLNRVVVASCTPRTHEALFQETVREAGLNAYLFEMANIRDQCTWVHTRLGDITEEKAIDLVKMAVGRARNIEALSTESYEPNHNALVVGGGVAGMTCALSIADQGFDVHLVEKAERLGGSATRVLTTIEGYKPSELVGQLISQIENHNRITTYLNSIVEECKGFVGDFTSRIKTNGDIIEVEHGAGIIATGASESKPDEYLFGQNDKVMTQQQIEQRIESDTEFIGGLKEVVMIQCVGSREPERMICSRVCCTEAIKNAMVIKRNNPDANVAILYRDVRTYGFKEQYYNQAREMGILFFRYDLDNKPVVTETTSGVEVRVRDLNSNLELSFSPDVLGLSAAMVPPDDCEDVSTAFKIPLNLDCFFLEAHMKLRPVDFASEGLYLCGTCHGPKFIDESVTQAKATAAKAVNILSKKEMKISGVVSVIDPDKCAVCLTCVRTCPYDVPRINEDGVAEIEKAICHGCGICASECPAKAIQLMHYKDKQVIAKIESLFTETTKTAK